MTPELWGRYMWFSIHFIALEYPENPTPQQKADYRKFFLDLWKVLPCYTCSQNYKKHLGIYPLTDEHLQSKETLFAWTVSLHNIVNKENGKSQMSVYDAKKMYSSQTFHKDVCGLMSSSKTGDEHQQNTNTKINKNNNVDMILVGMLGLLLGIVVTWSLGNVSIPMLPKIMKGGNKM